MSPVNGSPTCCRVALPRPLLDTFLYRLPAELREQASPGVRVRVPFSGRQLTGLIDELVTGPAAQDVYEVAEILDAAPLLSPPLLDLCRWVADYYVAPPGMVYRTALPPGLLGASGGGDRGELRRKVIRLTRSLPTLMERDRVFGRARRQREAYETLEGMGGAAPLAHLQNQLGFSRSVLTGLADRGLARIEEDIVARQPLGEAPDSVTLPRRLTGAQDAVVSGLLAQARQARPGMALLRGVTGSGKTVVYLRLIEETRRLERSAILLVPEISLTPQTVGRFRSAFDEEVAVLHSGLAPGERRDEWRALREGRKRIAIGTRSAIFAPVSRPGVIILDEEHDGSYKQSETPRYHARSVAAVRARLEGSLCVLGSATPSLESWHNARAGTYRLYELPERVTAHPLPRVELLDMREHGGRSRPPPAASGGDRQRTATPSEMRGEPSGQGKARDRSAAVISDRLREAVAARLARGEQCILLLNRRGYSTFLQCGSCGHVWSCPRCNVSLTYHRTRGRLVCHHCAFEEATPADCGECGSEDLTYSGIGTEQVERRIGEEFPAARILRLDVDTTGARGAHRRLLDRVRRREVDILLGTQMIAKGLDFPGVTLVGVINADVGLNLPDFRAAERTFQLLTQVAGRAGRGPQAGEVLIQTTRPAHFALRAALAHDYPGFASRELEDRAESAYPPHARLANLVISGPREERVATAAAGLADWTGTLLEKHGLSEVRLVGPAPCPIDRLRSRWRWHFLLKSDSAGALGTVLRYVARRRAHPGTGMRLEIDRDPEALL